MITMQLSGGMGNQMYQYALGKYLAKINNTDLLLDKARLEDHGIYKKCLKEVPRNYDLDIFNIHPKFTTKTIHNKVLRPLGQMKNFISRGYDGIYSKIIRQKVVREKKIFFNSDIKKLSNNNYLIGTWPSYKYWEEIEDDLKHDFSLKADLPTHIKDKINEILSCESICLNARRTDLSAESIGYFNEGIHIILNKLHTKNKNNIKIYITSDDIDWCKKNFVFDVPFEFIDKDMKGPKYSRYRWLMTNCKHFVGSNSTFCRRAIRRNWNKDKIIVLPESYNHSDFIPTKRNIISLPGDFGL